MAARSELVDRTVVLPSGKVMHFARRGRGVLAISGPRDIWGVIKHQTTRWYWPQRGMIRLKATRIGRAQPRH